jgi:hypothetical protein
MKLIIVLFLLMGGAILYGIIGGLQAAKRGVVEFSELILWIYLWPILLWKKE